MARFLIAHILAFQKCTVKNQIHVWPFLLLLIPYAVGYLSILPIKMLPKVFVLEKYSFISLQVSRTVHCRKFVVTLNKLTYQLNTSYHR